jgi:hypothetical protein
MPWHFPKPPNRVRIDAVAARFAFSHHPGANKMRAHKFVFAGILASGLILTSHAAAPSPADAAFHKLQSLAGEWQGKDADGMDAKTNFKVVAANTAVMETISPMHMEEMVTLYSLDGNSIALIHFCPTNNQPHMQANPTSADAKELIFEFKSVANLKTPESGHQHKLVLSLEDADHITENWTWRQNGKDSPMIFHFTRKKN